MKGKKVERWLSSQGQTQYGIHEDGGIIMYPLATHTTNTKSLVRQNAEQDPSYSPYCMRCKGISRMRIVEPFLWAHTCGATHDER